MRSTARSFNASSSSTPMPNRGPPPIARPVTDSSPPLLTLRRHWKWAAVCQFCLTFSTLINLDDVTVTDIEEDLLNSTMVVLPRLMQRLLITLTQDRKTNLENWQTILRRQYTRRDPQANPIGPEPPAAAQKSRDTTAEPEAEGNDASDDGQSEERDEKLPNGVDDRVNEQNVGVHVQDIELRNSGPDVATDAGNLNPDAAKVEETETTIVNGDGDSKADDIVESRDWAELDMLDKLESIHTVMEWHFQNPLRLRGIMRSDDDGASWRTEPIGYDAKHNAYWLIGTDRLWLQRPVPTPPKKRKPRNKPTPSKKPKVKLRIPASKAPKSIARLNKSEQRSSRTSRSSKSDRRKTVEAPDNSSSPIVSGRARAAKTQANVMLDLQAKQLLAVKAEMQSLSRSKGRKESHSRTSSPLKPAVGTRVSRRLRGQEDEDDEWQQIPEEWLSAAGSVKHAAPQPTRRSSRRESPRKKQREDSDDEFVGPKATASGTGLESGDESELTELSESESVAEVVDTIPNAPADSSQGAEEQEDEEEEEDKVPEVWPPPDFIEWETICVSLEEWEAIPKQFEGSKHYLEKALFKVLSKEIVPYITEGLREAAKLRAKEEALMQRKRSSRLAVREMEKETARLIAQQKADEDEKMARSRRQEARSKREEEERVAREQARERRRREREDRELARAKRQEWDSEQREDMDVDVDVEEQPATEHESKPPTLPVANGHAKASSTSSKPPRKRPSKKEAKAKASSEDWELNCEICGIKGRNRDDGVPIMCCGSCSKWQHIPCHDADDDRNGRPRRDWDKVDFTCRDCLSRQKVKIANGRKQSLQATAPSPLHPNLHQYPSQANPYPPSKHVGYPSDVSRQPISNSYQHFPAANNAHHPSLGHPPAPYAPSGPVTFAHYQPQQRGFAQHPTTLQLQPQPQMRQHQPYYNQSQSHHQYQHQPSVRTLHPSLQNGASHGSFPGPLQVPQAAHSSERSTQSQGIPYTVNHYPPVASGSVPYYQAPAQ